MKFRIQLTTYGRLIKQLLLKKQIINLDENLGGCCSREMQSLRYLHDLQTSDLDPKHSKKKKKRKKTQLRNMVAEIKATQNFTYFYHTWTSLDLHGKNNLKIREIFAKNLS